MPLYSPPSAELALPTINAVVEALRPWWPHVASANAAYFFVYNNILQTLLKHIVIAVLVNRRDAFYASFEKIYSAEEKGADEGGGGESGGRRRRSWREARDERAGESNRRREAE